MAKNLILFSGGYDSTYLVYKYLVDTSDEITLLVMTSENNLADGLNRSQLLQMQPTLKQLKTYRDFKVIYHVIDKDKVNSWYMDEWYRYSTTVFADDLNNGTYDSLMIGTSWEQHDGQYYKNSLVRGITPSASLMKNPTKGLTRGRFLAPLITHDIHDNFNRWHIFKYMPEELLTTITQKNPGKLAFDEIVQIGMSSLGWTASDVDSWRQEKNREYGGGSRDLSYPFWTPTHLGKENIHITGVADEKNRGKMITVKTKQDCIDWYSTVEYNFKTDYSLITWNLSKDDFNPDN
jgi:hypothetical protein